MLVMETVGLGPVQIRVRNVSLYRTALVDDHS
jgi:hypothetical protein